MIAIYHKTINLINNPAIMKYHLLPIRLAKTEKTDNT